MAWFRMMGVDSVEYHRATVLGRDDDHAGQAILYYGSRGETPLVWGGGARRASWPRRRRGRRRVRLDLRAGRCP